MKEEKKQMKEQVMRILADLYCDYYSIAIDDLQELALFLYKNASYGPTGTKEVANSLYALDHAIQVRKESLPSFFAKDRKVCLGNIINPDFTPFYSDLAQKYQEIRDNIHSVSLDVYFSKLMLKMYRFILKNKDEKLEKAFLQKFNMSMTDFFSLNYKSLTGTYTNSKIFDAFLEEYYHPVVDKQEKIENHPVSKEVIRDFFNENTELEDTMLTKAQEMVNQLQDLLERTEDLAKTATIKEVLFALRVAIISNNFGNLHEAMKQATLLTEETLKR